MNFFVKNEENKATDRPSEQKWARTIKGSLGPSEAYFGTFMIKINQNYDKFGFKFFLLSDFRTFVMQSMYPWGQS